MADGLHFQMEWATSQRELEVQRVMRTKRDREGRLVAAEAMVVVGKAKVMEMTHEEGESEITTCSHRGEGYGKGV